MGSKTKTIAIVLGLIVAAISIGAAVQQYLLPGKVTISSVPLAMYVDGVEWINGTAIDYGEGPANSTFTKELSVQNLGSLNCTLYLYLINLPAGWSESWTANATFTEPNEWANGTLTLTVPAGATDGTYSWDRYLIGKPS